MNNNSGKPSLKVQEGIEQPPDINPLLSGFFRGRRTSVLSAAEYVAGITGGNRNILSQAITLVESSKPSHFQLGQEVIEKCLPYSGNSLRIGITGVPGVGKSTFIEALGKHLTNTGNRVAVLAIDPSSQRSRGSILGDKTRMEELAADARAFIRPSPSAGSLGGVARKTRETVVLCEAAGYNIIFIETVGVGQSETAVHAMVDFFLLLMLAGAGDELQGIKRGIMEMADAIVINKADGDNIPLANRAMAQYQNALHLFPPPGSGWTPRVEVCSSLTGKGIENVWAMISDYFSLVRKNRYFEQKRHEQNKVIMFESIHESLREKFFNDPSVMKHLEEIERELDTNKVSSYTAARKILGYYFDNRKE